MTDEKKSPSIWDAIKRADRLAGNDAELHERHYSAIMFGIMFLFENLDTFAGAELDALPDITEQPEDYETDLLMTLAQERMNRDLGRFDTSDYMILSDVFAYFRSEIIENGMEFEDVIATLYEITSTTKPEIAFMIMTTFPGKFLNSSSRVA